MVFESIDEMCISMLDIMPQTFFAWIFLSDEELNEINNEKKGIQKKKMEDEKSSYELLLQFAHC